MGRPGESHALAVARHYGLPKRVLHQARHHLPRQGQKFAQAIRATTASRAASEEARSEAHAALVEAQARQQQYEAKLSELHRLSEQFTEWVSSLPAMKPGDEVYVRRFGRPGKLVRLQLSRQVAVVSVDGKEMEVPLQELMPDIGDTQVRGEIPAQRRQIAEQARPGESAATEAQRLEKEYQRSLSALRQRQQQFDA
jgi:dsDNA-specific endonuclease/ATPase MutS2